ncbi:hypothetical protein V3C99_018562 [Haemonchus contortus]
MPKKASNEATLVLRRVPVLVIPRKRKYKNYVSRRRNTQLLASLRKCVSDPHLYRSYNHWKGLWKEFSPTNTTSPSVDIPRLIDEEDPPRTPVVTSIVVAPTVDAGRSPLLKQVSERIGDLENNGLSQAAHHIPFLSEKGATIQGRRPFRKGLSPKTFSTCSISDNPKTHAFHAKSHLEEFNDNQPGEKDSKLRSSVDITVKGSACLVLEKSRAPSPASFINASPESFGDKSIATVNKKAKTLSKFIITGPALSGEQCDMATITPLVPKVLKKAYGSKSGTTICAIGPSLNATSVKNVNTEDQRVIEKKVSLRKRVDQVKESAVGQAPLKCQMDIGDKSNQADEQRAKRTLNAIAAAFSTQSNSIDNPENAKMEEKREVVMDTVQQVSAKGSASATSNLLAQLQLPPTVSAKVDKIIALGQKSRIHKPSDQRARMKAHLDRQVGVLPDDDDGHLIFKKNDVLHGRWELREELGEGTFGRVIKAYDKQRDKMRAVKIVRNVHKYRDAAYLEIKVLTKLKQLDPNGTQ